MTLWLLARPSVPEGRGGAGDVPAYPRDRSRSMRQGRPAVATKSAVRRSRGALLLGMLTIGLLILTADSLGSQSLPSVASPVGPAGSWSLAFADEFNGTAVDWTRWADHSSAEADQGHGNKGNQQLEWNQGANCTVSNGVLHMTAERGTHGSYAWTSCLITSTPSYSFQYGYIEERAQLPAAKGFWPAFWTWSTGSTYIETDAYEFHSDNPRRLHVTQHSGGGGGCTVALGFDPSAGMHVYGVDIEPTGTTWYVDGYAVCSKPSTSPGRTALISDNFVYSAVPPDPETTSATKEVDYIRAYVSRSTAPAR
jgi:hypothetical protein